MLRALLAALVVYLIVVGVLVATKPASLRGSSGCANAVFTALGAFIVGAIFSLRAGGGRASPLPPR